MHLNVIDLLAQQIQITLKICLQLRQHQQQSANEIVTVPSSQFHERGERECLKITLEDGRSLVCTSEHRIRATSSSSGITIVDDHFDSGSEFKTSWMTANQLEVGESRVLCSGLQLPQLQSYDAGDLLCESQWRVDINEHMSLRTNTIVHRSRALAFARLCGAALGASSKLHNNELITLFHVSSRLDAERVVADIFTVCTTITPIIQAPNKKSSSTHEDGDVYAVAVPHALYDAFSAALFQSTQQKQQKLALPSFIISPQCPRSVQAEFLAALFGSAAGTSAALSNDNTIHSPQLRLNDSQTTLLQINNLLVDRFDIESSVASDSTTLTVNNIPLSNLLKFTHTLGYRYNWSKTWQLSLLSVYARAAVNNIGCAAEQSPMVWLKDANLLHHLHKSDVTGDAQVAQNATQKALSSNDDDAMSQTTSKRYGLPTYTLRVIDIQPAGQHPVYDIGVVHNHSFVANSMVVHNCMHLCLCGKCAAQWDTHDPHEKNCPKCRAPIRAIRKTF